MPRSPTERAANADDVEDAKLFIEWLFSSDDNLHDFADIDKKTTLLLALPTVSGIELDFDTSQLMEEDLTKFGSAREATLAKWDEVTSGKEVVSSKWGAQVRAARGAGERCSRLCRPRGIYCIQGALMWASKRKRSSHGKQRAGRRDG